MPASSGAPSLDDPQAARTAGRDWLSLALLDARNRTLGWLARFESVGTAEPADSPRRSPWLTAGRAGWLQERWVGRNVRRLSPGVQPGASPEVLAGGLRLPSLDPRADDWFADETGRPQRVHIALPEAADVRAYLATTLEQTLELLATTPQSDDALWVYRHVLRLEDQAAERWAEWAQEAGIDPGHHHVMASPAVRPSSLSALWVPAQRYATPAPDAGFVAPDEPCLGPVSLPEFEIDARAVSWAQFAEFAEDGGYDRPECWSAEGWRWVERLARRAPRYVEQWRSGVLAEHFGVLSRVAPGQAAAHVTRHEALAWCTWAGRRLPSELEWELAAQALELRGFVWGEVWEWVGSGDTPHELYRPLRGASAWTVPRARCWRGRRMADAADDRPFVGFRSCAW